MSVLEPGLVDSSSRGALPWYERAMRWAQLTLVGDDPREGSGFDAGFWIDYFREIRADAACLSAGGYMAFYPSDLPGHRRSPFLGDADPFGDLVAGCRELGIVVMARIDSHAVHDEVAREHPEWLARDEQGRPRPHWSAPDVWLTCPFGPYATDFVPRLNAEIVTRYDVDAIFANRWAGEGRCFCDVCRGLFRTATGLEIPSLPVDSEWSGTERTFLDWWESTLLATARTWDSQIRALKPTARFIPNSGGGVLSAFDMSELARQTDILFADKQARSGLQPAWTSGRHAKEFRAVMGSKPVGGIFSVGIEEAPRWKDSVQAAEEIRMWVASATANGVRAWFTKFGGAVHDRRWLPVVRDIYRWQAENEKYLRNTAPVADVGIVYSQQTARMFGAAQSEQAVQAPILGWYQALVEGRVPFEMVHDHLLDEDSLGAIRVLILPNVAALSDEQCTRLRAFVHRGGRLIATHGTGLFDEKGGARGDFALADLFGVSYDGEVRRGMSNSYLELHPFEDDPVDPVLAALSDTSRIINAVNVVSTRPLRGDDSAVERSSPLTLVDTFPDLPMEEVYQRDVSTGRAQLVLSRFERGRVAYLAGDLDRSFHEYLVRDHREVLAGVVRWARAAHPLVDVIGAGVVEVTAWRQESSMTVHLVNFTNPMYLKGPFGELLPSPPQHVAVRLPEGSQVVAVRLLRSGIERPVVIEDGVLHVEVPEIVDFEVVAVDFG